MLTTRANLSIKAGDTLVIQFDVVDQDGAVVDIAGSTQKFAIARRLGEEIIISTEAPASNADAEVIDADEGTFKITVSGDETEDLKGAYIYECELTDSNDNKSTIATGTIQFESDLIE